MKVLIVNINKNRKNMTVLDAASEAWKLKFSRAINCDYLVAVASGNIIGCFNIKNVAKHENYLDRIIFELVPCISNDEVAIVKYIIDKNIHLKRFVTKYLD